jgi:hypothetical protein
MPIHAVRAAKLPHVPGAKGRRPEPNPVAITQELR